MVLSHCPLLLSFFLFVKTPRCVLLLLFPYFSPLSFLSLFMHISLHVQLTAKKGAALGWLDGEAGAVR